MVCVFEMIFDHSLAKRPEIEEAIGERDECVLKVGCVELWRQGKCVDEITESCKISMKKL